jgi:hypothetical protein
LKQNYDSVSKENDELKRIFDDIDSMGDSE